NVSHLEGVIGSKLILQCQVVALRVRRLVVKVFAYESNTARFGRCGREWNGRQTILNRGDRPVRKRDRSVRHLVREAQVELERKVSIRQQCRVLEATVENSVTPTCHQFRRDLIGKTDAWSEVCLLRNTESRLARAL